MNENTKDQIFTKSNETKMSYIKLWIKVQYNYNSPVLAKSKQWFWNHKFEVVKFILLLF